MENLQKSILRTLAFFAAQGQAATLLEIRTNLLRASSDQNQPSLGEVEEALLGSLSGQIRHERGLFALSGHEAVICERAGKYNRTLKLFKKARRWASGLRFVPFVRAVAISGSAALGNASSDSDIDLLILVKNKRIFLTRFLVSAYFQIFGGRRHGKNIIGRFCLNHYVACGKKLQDDKNLYTAAEYSGLIPVFGRDKISEFWQANSDWIGENLLCPNPPSTHFFIRADSRPARLQITLEKLISPLASYLERLLKGYQMRRIHPSRFILVSDDELSFHPDSKGQSILSKYKEILSGAMAKMS